MKRQTYTQGWAQYPAECAGHHIQGGLAGLSAFWIASPQGIALAALWTVLYVAYQGLSMVRKGDSAGLDVMDYMVGFGVAAGGVAFVSLF